MHTIMENNKIIAGVLVGAALGVGGMSLGNEFDCKDTNCQVQVFVEEPNFKDAIYYKPSEWNEKSAEDIALEKKARYDNWKAFVDEQSKKVNEEVN